MAGQNSPCDPRPNMCFDSEQERDTAVTQCQYGYSPPFTGEYCPIQGRFMSNNQRLYRPCDIEYFPVCGESAAEARRRIQVAQAAAAAAAEAARVEAVVAARVEARLAEAQVSMPEPAPEATPEYIEETIYDDDPAPVFEQPVSPPYAPLVAPPVEPEPEDKSFMVLGILGAVVIGGGAVYLMTRKKKKGKKKKR